MSDKLDQVELATTTLQVLANHGADFSQPRHVLHFFYGGDLPQLENKLLAAGYSVRPTQNHDGLIAERNEVIGEIWRVTTLKQLCELATGLGVAYDGWEASVEPTVAGSRTVKPTGWVAKLFGKKS